MMSEEWGSSDDASAMLKLLCDEQPEFFRTQIGQLHKYLIACCWKHQNLIPQEGLRDGLRGAGNWIAGKITDEELDRLNWYAEAEAFFLDYAETPEDLSAIKSLIASIDEVRELPFEQARTILLRAAYFAESVMIYPKIRPTPWNDTLFSSDLLCPDLLREFVTPDFR